MCNRFSAFCAVMDFVVNSCDECFMVCFDDRGDNPDVKDGRIGGKSIYEMFRPLVATFIRGTKPVRVITSSIL